MNKLLFAGLIALVTAALVGGFAVVGGPGQARAEKRDVVRHTHLRRLADHITCQQPLAEVETGTLPPSRCAGFDKMPDVADPLTGEAYDVAQTENDFAVCAQFETDQTVRERGYYGYVNGARTQLHLDGLRGCLRYARENAQGNWQKQ